MRAIERPRTETQTQDLFFDRFRQQLTPEGIAIFNRIIEENRLFNVYTRRSFTGSGRNNDFDFSHFIKIGDLFKRIYNLDTMIPEAEREQEGLEHEYERLERYNPRVNGSYYSLKKEVQNNIKHLKDGRELVINAFTDRIFPLSDPRFYPQYREDYSDEGSSGSHNSQNIKIIN